MVQKKSYLNNKDLLAEIHRSKQTYCSFLDTNDFEYDYIVDDIDRMNSSRLNEAIEARAERLTKNAIRKMVESEGISLKAANKRIDEVLVPVSSVTIEDVVVREMTYSHIPQEENKSGKLVYPKLKFPPFKHYRYQDGHWVEVLRSHWEGGFENGSFNQDQGHMTNKLAKMVMMLIERISQKGNYRGYSYISDMRSAAMVHMADVSLKFDESKGDNPFAFYTTIIEHSFKGVLNNEKKHRMIRDELMMSEGYDPSHTAILEHEIKEKAAEVLNKKATEKADPYGYSPYSDMIQHQLKGR